MHKDIEYTVDATGIASGYLKTFDEASIKAMQLALAYGEATIDVLVYSEEGAAAYGGDDAVERYREDPDASVFERIVVNAKILGRIP